MDKGQKAKDLMIRAALDNPVMMVVMDSIIESRNEVKLDELIVILEKRVKDREENYLVFKKKMMEIAKSMMKKG